MMGIHTLHTSCFFSDHSLGIRRDDSHGGWHMRGSLLGLWYNYMGKADKIWAYVYYVRIRGSNSWMLAPPDVQQKYCSGCTILVPYDPEADIRAAAEAASSSEGPPPPDLDLEDLSARGEKRLFPEGAQDDQDL